MKRLYLAYGSNLNIPQMHRRCPDARIYGTTELLNYRLKFKGSKTGSYLTIEKEFGYYVPMAVWEVSAADEKNLDVYEGYPTFYYKKKFELPIWTEDGKEEVREAFAYVMHEDHKIGMPTQHYYNVCLDGYNSFGFDSDRLDEAVEYSVLEYGKSA